MTGRQERVTREGGTSMKVKEVDRDTVGSSSWKGFREGIPPRRVWSPEVPLEEIGRRVTPGRRLETLTKVK